MALEGWLIPALVLALHGLEGSEIRSLRWSHDGNSTSQDANSTTSAAAYRDILLEKTTRRVFAKLMVKVQDGSLSALEDPFRLPNIRELTQEGPLYEITLSARKMKAQGLKNLRMTYLRVIRHFGLRDIKIFVRLETDLVIQGQYRVNGSALSIIPVNGAGGFAILIKGLTASTVFFLTLEEEAGTNEDTVLTVRDLDLHVGHEDVSFEFQDLMGGGVLGSALNTVINAMGEVIMANQRQAITSALKRDFQRVIETFL